jgi:hypothetical protein
MKPRARSSHSPLLRQPAVVQQLEQRTLPAGNVTVVFDGADVVITGDSAANDVHVLFNGVDVVVRGLNGTKINGGAADFIAAAGSNTLGGDLEVNLKKGNDLLYISGGVNVTGDVEVTPSLGNDSTVIKDATVTGDIVIGAPFGLADDPGHDSVAIITSTADTVSIALGSGNDIAVLENLAASGDVLALFGSGNDLLTGDFSAVENVLVGMGAGNDVFFGDFTAGGFGIDLEAGNDTLGLFDVAQTDPARQAFINLGTGNDAATVGFSSSSFASQLSVTGSSGVDRFFLVPGAVLNDGLSIAEVESTAPYIVVADPLLTKKYAATFKRAEAFAAFLGTLP